MNGDPIDPITFDRAITQLWERLAANAGIDLTSHLLSDDQEHSNSESYVEQQEKLQALREEADMRVWGLAVVEEIRAWAAEGNGWRRVSREAVGDRVGRAADEPWGLYVDRNELAAILAARWPDDFGGGTTLSICTTSQTRSTAQGKGGRPKGDGYSLKDVPTFQKILSAQRESGDVESQYALVKRFAGDVNSPSYWTNVDRLRKTLPKWLEKNGHEWRRSI